MNGTDLGVTGSVNGSMIGFVINGSYVSCETSCSFDFDVEMIPASPVDSGRWGSNIPGVRTWSMTVDGNLLLRTVGADFKTVLNAVISGDRLEVKYRTRMGITPEVEISGFAYPQTGNTTAPRLGKATWNVTFVGDGPFNLTYEEFWLIINNMPINNNYQTIVEEDWDEW